MHALRVGYYSSLIGKVLGFNESECDLLFVATAWHDVGKIQLPNSVLFKPGPLDYEEMSLMRTHTFIGADLLKGNSSQVMRIAQDVAQHHHERWDGSGYPMGLKSYDIPLASRICALGDVFDALVTERPYKKALASEVALDKIRTGRGRHFDPSLADAMFKIFLKSWHSS